MATALDSAATATDPRFDREVTTTCGYCGVGCRLETHAAGNRIVSIGPALDGPANEGHTCLKGRFAHGFTRSGFMVASRSGSATCAATPVMPSRMRSPASDWKLPPKDRPPLGSLGIQSAGGSANVRPSVLTNMAPIAPGLNVRPNRRS